MMVSMMELLSGIGSDRFEKGSYFTRFLWQAVQIRVDLS
jgi:hypothetical protein